MYFGVLFLLEDELGNPVDLVTEKAMRAELKPFIERKQLMSEREWLFCLDNMIIFAENILTYSERFNQTKF